MDLKVKENPAGTAHKHKAKLVAKGFHQKAGFDFNENLQPSDQACNHSNYPNHCYL